MTATLLGPKLGQIRKVKNLGYVFRNYGAITEFHVIGNGQNAANEFTLRVRFFDGRVYETQFASWQVAMERFWLRSIFEGIPIYFWDCVPVGSFNRYGRAELRQFGTTNPGPEAKPTQRWEVAYIANQKRETRYSTGADYCLSFLGSNDRGDILR